MRADWNSRKTSFSALAAICWTHQIAYGQTAFDNRSLKSEDVPAASISIMNRIKDVIELKYSNKKMATYSAVALRLSQCSLMYGVLSKGSEADATQAQNLKVASKVYSDASAFLYPGTAANYNFDVRKGMTELETLRLDKRKLFYFTRNCYDFWEPKTVENAILELFLD